MAGVNISKYPFKRHKCPTLWTVLDMLFLHRQIRSATVRKLFIA